jgi:chemotaxis protein MotA
MDLGLIVGIPLGFAFILGGILVSGYSLGTYIDVTSILITIGGSFSALMVANPLGRVRKVMTFFNVAARNQKLFIDEIIPRLVTFSEKSRREGLLSLEDDIESLDDEFFKQGIQLVVDGTDPDVIKRILYNEMNQITERHAGGIKLFDDWGKFAPAFGMIGTLFGLVGMLSSLGDQSGIGAGMSAALITTFYGAILANLIFIPIKGKLEDKDAQEALVKEIIIEGILSIQTGDNPRIVEQKLLAFLPPSMRDKMRQTAD